MRLLRAALIVGALGVAGCGVTTTEQAYNAALIRQVGAGSVAAGRVLPTLQALAKTSGLFNDPGTSQAMVYLFKGRLDKLTEADLNRIGVANQEAAGASGGVVRKLDGLESALRASAVNANSFSSLPEGSKTFITRWNQYLATTASTLTADGAALMNLAPVYKEFPGLLQAARDTAELHSTVQFDKVRRAVLNDLRPRYQQMQNAMQGNTSALGTERQLVDFVNHNQQAQAIVTKVNHDDPSGWLAQEFKPSSQ